MQNKFISGMNIRNIKDSIENTKARQQKINFSQRNACTYMHTRISKNLLIYLSISRFAFLFRKALLLRNIRPCPNAFVVCLMFTCHYNLTNDDLKLRKCVEYITFIHLFIIMCIYKCTQYIRHNSLIPPPNLLEHFSPFFQL